MDLGKGSHPSRGTAVAKALGWEDTKVGGPESRPEEGEVGTPGKKSGVPWGGHGQSTEGLGFNSVSNQKPLEHLFSTKLVICI